MYITLRICRQIHTHMICSKHGISISKHGISTSKHGISISIAKAFNRNKYKSKVKAQTKTVY